MKMKNYWFVNFLFNLLFYSMQATVFYTFGKYIF